MRKDYIPVDDNAATEDETSFVERYWTDVWKEHHQPPDLSRLTQGEEYSLIRPFLEQLPRGGRILDAGCGLGAWTVLFAQQGFDAVGLDLSDTVIDTLKVRLPTHQFVRGDIRQTGFDAESFDACLSWGAFEHFENGLGGCLDEVRRILRPGGHLYISVPFDNWRHILRDAGRLERWDEHFDPDAGYRKPQRFYQWRLTRPELQRELELHGFQTRLVSPISKLQGVGRWLQWDFPVVKPNTRPYFLARRLFAAVMPARYISHMLLAVAVRR